jgi:hypothetical protein
MPTLAPVTSAAPTTDRMAGTAFVSEGPLTRTVFFRVILRRALPPALFALLVRLCVRLRVLRPSAPLLRFQAEFPSPPSSGAFLHACSRLWRR